MNGKDVLSSFPLRGVSPTRGCSRLKITAEEVAAEEIAAEEVAENYNRRIDNRCIDNRRIEKTKTQSKSKRTKQIENRRIERTQTTANKPTTPNRQRTEQTMSTTGGDKITIGKIRATKLQDEMTRAEIESNNDDDSSEGATL